MTAPRTNTTETTTPRTDSLIRRRGEIRDHALYELCRTLEKELADVAPLLRLAEGALEKSLRILVNHSTDEDKNDGGDAVRRVKSALTALRAALPQNSNGLKQE